MLLWCHSDSELCKICVLLAGFFFLSKVNIFQCYFVMQHYNTLINSAIKLQMQSFHYFHYKDSLVGWWEERNKKRSSSVPLIPTCALQSADLSWCVGRRKTAEGSTTSEEQRYKLFVSLLHKTQKLHTKQTCFTSHTTSTLCKHQHQRWAVTRYSNVFLVIRLLFSSKD